MKKYILFSLVAISFAACTNKAENNGIVANETVEVKTTNMASPKTEIAPENLAQADLKIEGMTCQMGCANTIKTKLESLNGVANANVSFDDANAIVSYDKTLVTEQDLKNTVNNIADGKLYKVIE